MSENLQTQLQVIREGLDKSEADLVETVEDTPEVSLEKPESLITHSVESRAVHSRGATVVDLDTERERRSKKEMQRERQLTEVPEKGDVYVNPATGERQVVVDVTGEGQNCLVHFIKELEPGVRAEPGRAVRQLPIKNFEVQREVGGYSQKLPGFEQEYDEIFEASQEVFDAANKVYARQSARGSIAPEAQDIMDQVGDVARQVADVDDAWEILKAENDPKQNSYKREKLAQLKQLVAKIPPTFLEPFPVLERIQRQDAKQERDYETDKSRERRPKQAKSIRRNVRGSEVEKKPENNQRRRGRRGLGETATGFEGDSYGQGAQENLESRILIRDWVEHIRSLQAAFNQLKDEIREHELMKKWQEAVRALDTDGTYKRFVREAQTPAVVGRSENIESAYLAWDQRISGREEQVTAWLKELDEYAKSYEAVIKAGEELLQAKSSEPGRTSEGGQRAAISQDQPGEAAKPKEVSGSRRERQPMKKWDDIEVGVQAEILKRITDAAKGFAGEAKTILTQAELDDAQLQVVLHEAVVTFVEPVLKKAAKDLRVSLRPKELEQLVGEVTQHTFELE